MNIPSEFDEVVSALDALQALVPETFGNIHDAIDEVFAELRRATEGKVLIDEADAWHPRGCGSVRSEP